MEYDLIIVGSGPVGLAAGIEAKKNGLKIKILEKGVLANSLFNFPTFMRFFTTAALLEIGDHPFPSTDVKPTRQQALDYYRRVVEIEQVPVLQHHKVTNIEKINDIFNITGSNEIKGKIKNFTFKSKYMIIATGYFDNPIGLGGISGENLQNVSYYYSEPHQFYNKDIVIIGAGNSGAEAALELYRHGARVTIIHNKEKPKESLKYWVGPDLKNRLKNNEIKSVMPGKTTKISNSTVFVQHNGNEIQIPFDQTFIFTGFTPNMRFLNKIGVTYDKDTLSCHLSNAFESISQNNLFVIGSTGFGRATNKVFIENGREHAVIAIQEILSRFD